jgi:hypothetical protein
MRFRILGFTSAVALLLIASMARAQLVPNPITFEDLTDNGFGLKFSNDASASFTIANVGGSNRMLVPRTGAFQEADTDTGNTGSGFYQAMAAANANPANSFVSYDYYIDTSNWGVNAGTFFQVGLYFNGGSGEYHQDFAAVKELELSGAQVASGQVFSGTVTVNIAAAGLTLVNPQTFYRMGFIENGDGSAQAVYFDNINITTVPEPSTIVLGGLAGLGLMVYRRRK